jgi:hypothetical protein
MQRARDSPGSFMFQELLLPVRLSGRAAQQELLHLHVTAIFFVTFLIVICYPPFYGQ